jgi:hypothetical protein
MKFQTFTIKEEINFKKFHKETQLTISKNTKNKYTPTHLTKHQKATNILSIEYNHSGTIILNGFYEKSELEYQGILCNAYIEYLGFRDTKKFNKMLSEISKSLEDICCVHTGEIK